MTPQGLRERKKAKTRAEILRHATRLFREQGFAATTVEQVAQAAEVAPSTVFRYFATKEDLVTAGEHDHLIWEAFQAQPAGLSVVQAWRRAIHSVVAGVPSSELAVHRDRELLVLAVPELWASSLKNITQMISTMAELSAERAGRDPSDPEIRNLAGAVFGVLLAVMLDWVRNPDLDIARALDEALDHLDSGLPL